MTSGSSQTESSNNKWAVVAGGLVAIAGISFVIQTAIRNWDEVSSSLENASLGLLFLSFLLGSLAMCGIGVAWHRALGVLGSPLPAVSSLRGYFVGQLGKYVPGGIWAIVGRGEWARSEGVPGPIAYTGVILSIGSAYLAALVVSLALLPFGTSLEDNSAYALVLILLPIGIIALHPVVLRRILEIVRKITSRQLALTVPSWGSTVAIVLQQLPSWILIGLVSVTVAGALGSSGDVVNVILATCLAWVVGFIALPTPGGIGVREAVFVALATSLPAGVAATVALIGRLVFITVDATLALLISVVFSRRRNRVAGGM